MSHKEKKFSHVLLVDDDVDELMLLRDTFDALNFPFEISYSSSYSQLCEFVETTDKLPDIVFLDINMTRQDGRECLKMLRTDARFDNIPVVMYSNSSNPDNINECLSLGANLYVMKPSSFEKIKQTMARIFALDWQNVSNSGYSEKVILN